MTRYTFNELVDMLEQQEHRVIRLENALSKMRNEYAYDVMEIREGMDAVDGTISRLYEVIKTLHYSDEIVKQLEYLEERSNAPISQLLREFVEEKLSKLDQEALAQGIVIIDDDE